MRTVAVVIGLLLLASAAAAKDSPVAGRWTLEMDRGGGQPRVCRATLVLKRKKSGWEGSIAFRTILYARKHPLKDVEVRGKKVKFSLDHAEFDLRFSGRLKDDVLEGRCAWKGYGDYPFKAGREAPPRPVMRFDKGLTFQKEFRKTDPKDVGVDGEALDRLIAAAEDSRSSALIVMKDGRVICERYFGGRDEKIHLMSVTKFVAVMAVALLIEEKKISALDAKLSTWFPEWKDGRRGKVTLRHLLNHTSGIRHGKTARELNAEKDKVKYVRASPVTEEPGTKFSYNNDAVALLTGVIRAAAGEPADAYLAKKLFAPMGIRDYAWDRDEAGNSLTYAQLSMRPRDLAKLGLLVAANGKWRKKTLFPAKWIETLGKPGSGLSDRCGLIWWRRTRPGSDEVALYHTGWLGQHLAIYPESEIVAVRLRRYDGSEAADRNLGSFMSLLEDLPED